MATATRKIVHIDPDRCNGCGECVPSCAEGAIQIIDGKARLIADNLCDGLGNCLGQCPTDAIVIEERPADAFDEQAVEQWKAKLDAPAAAPAGGCPGSRMRKLDAAPAQDASQAGDSPSQLGHWPVQLALVPVMGDIWTDADVLIAADCVPFAAADFHAKLLTGRTLAIACPKLDDVQPYIEKLANIFAGNSIKSITVAHMEVPCCFGILHAVKEALAISEADIPLHDVEVTIDGKTMARS